MCWNQPVSWITFILGTLCTIVFATLTNNSTIAWYVFFQCIITVQLGEALIWGGKNVVGTYIAFFAVWIQPLFLTFLLFYVGIRPILCYLMLALSLVYLIVSIPHIRQLQQNTYEPLVCGTNGEKHIDFKAWGKGGVMSTLYLVISLVCILFLFPMYPYVAGYLLLTLLISQVFYQRVFSSIWCWFAVFTPVVCFLTKSLPSINTMVPWVKE